jgi:hypothetical protein
MRCSQRLEFVIDVVSITWRLIHDLQQLVENHIANRAGN